MFIILFIIIILSIHQSQASSAKTPVPAQPTVTQAFSKGIKFVPTSNQARELNCAVAYFIAKDMMPLRMVGKSVFLHLMKKAVAM